MTELLAVTLITTLAVTSPGADFAVITRNSLLHGRRVGMLCALSIALGVQVYVFCTIFGIGLLIAHMPTLLHDIKPIGTAYLVWIGWKTLPAKPLPSGETAGNSVSAPTLSAFAALHMGFLTNTLNPKTTLFVVSTYTQVVHTSTPLLAQLGYGLFMSAAHTMQFALVAAAFASGALRHSLLARQRVVDSMIGVILIGLELVLGLARLA